MRQGQGNLFGHYDWLWYHHQRGWHNYYHYIFGDEVNDGWGILGCGTNLYNGNEKYHDQVEDSFAAVEVGDGGYVKPAN